MSTAFTPSGYEGGDTAMSGGGQIAAADCADRAPGMIGKCFKYTYTPAATPTWAGVAFILGYTGFGTAGHAPVCLADGATYINFYAKGAVGGEMVTFSAEGTANLELTLTNTWTLYQIPLTGVAYNSFASGLATGFFWKVVPPTTGTAPVASFQIDSVQYVNTGAAGGGAGGAGGTGGAATAGTGGGGAGGIGGGGAGGAP